MQQKDQLKTEYNEENSMQRLPIFVKLYIIEQLNEGSMKEEFLHFVWKHRLYDNPELTSTDGERIEVVSAGYQNFDAGPDFTDARIIIDGTLWVGNVEIHHRASDWNAHKHQLDKSYNNVILHVVSDANTDVYTQQKERLRCFCMHTPSVLINNYTQLLAKDNQIPCADKIKSLPSIKLKFWIDRLLAERMMNKTKVIREQLEQTANNWNEIFYRFLAQSFGFKTNAEPFEQLARLVPLKILAKHRENLLQIEALLFGCAGLLSSEKEINDSYFEQLCKEYKFLKAKYKLEELTPQQWKFAKMRPLNFPTIRIAQFAQLIHQSYALFSKVVELEDVSKIRKLLQTTVSSYWETHYTFGKESSRKNKALGQASINGLLINTIVPFIFVYGEAKGKEELKERAISFLEKMPSEKNSIIDHWQESGIKSQSAFDSQALIQLRNEYCKHNRCLHCAIGTSIVRS